MDLASEHVLTELLLIVVTAIVTAATMLAVVKPRRAPPPPARDPLLSTDVVREVVDRAPLAIVVYGDTGAIQFANPTARELFFEGQKPEGTNLLSLLEHAPPPLRSALLGGDDDLFTVEHDGERETYHLAKREVSLGGEAHTLLMVKHLTHEIARQEVETWKKLIRVLSHELNNSLAPMSSLMHSARLLVRGGPNEPKLARVFDTVADRVEHLKSFLESYAQFARMPAPRKQRLPWSALADPLRALYPESQFEIPVGAGFFDPAQMGQVLINVIKNAEEAGSPREAIRVEVQTVDGVAHVTIADRGEGMTPEVMKRALLPFYSTKERGSGLGLPLCREIVEAHGGRLRIQSREGGGTILSFDLPLEGRRPGATGARLTLTRN
jgi:nitrogen fixation/metabolism regulation signal transduction histidine kinase